jgi:hypothetical protein
VERLQKLSWRSRGTGAGNCTAEVDEPIRGYRAKVLQAPKPGQLPEGAVPTVSWISFDGDVYWVRLAVSPGWPRTIRVTQSDVDGTTSRRTP